MKFLLRIGAEVILLLIEGCCLICGVFGVANAALVSQFVFFVKRIRESKVDRINAMETGSGIGAKLISHIRVVFSNHIGTILLALETTLAGSQTQG